MPMPPWVDLRPKRWPATDPDAVILDLAPAAWWRFHDGSYSDAGTTLCVADDPIRQVNDKSGNNRHVTQATLASRPLWKPNVLNGKAVGRFDGIDDFMQNTFGATLTQPNTIYVVGKFASSNDVMFDGLSGARHFLDNLSGIWRCGAPTAIGGGLSNLNTHLFTLQFNTTSSILRVDGQVIASGNAGTNALTGITLGATFTPNTFLTGDIGELSVFDALHDAAQIAAVEAHLAAYYAIAI